jgi:hypothetical protein
MKQVTLQTDTVSLSEVVKNKNPLVGFTNGDLKVALVRADHGGTNYYARSIDSWGDGDGYSIGWKYSQSISAWANHFIGILSPNNKMFVFDTPQELFKWMSE